MFLELRNREKNMDYFIGDTPFGHQNILEFGRPGYKDIEDHNVSCEQINSTPISIEEIRKELK